MIIIFSIQNLFLTEKSRNYKNTSLQMFKIFTSLETLYIIWVLYIIHTHNAYFIFSRNHKLPVYPENIKVFFKTYAS